LLENAVFIELLRIKERNPLVEINYFSSKDGEVDFVISEGGSVKELIQVAYELNQNNMERELRPLLGAMKYLKPKRSILVTFDPVNMGRIVKKGIETLTFVQWALNTYDKK